MTASHEWTPIALCRDVPAGTTRGVVVNGRELVIWRGEDGVAHVWEDRCPHRGMRLSFGFVRGNALNCLYHGWQYGASASCVRIPAHPDLAVPPTIRANAYVASEAGSMVWVRLGDSDLPVLPDDAVPVLSVAVDAEDFDAPHLFTLPLDTATLHVGWHRVDQDRIMLHAVMSGAGDIAAAVRMVRSYRAKLEQGSAA